MIEFYERNFEQSEEPRLTDIKVQGYGGEAEKAIEVKQIQKT